MAKNLEARKKRAYELHATIGHYAKNFADSILNIGFAFKQMRDEKLYRELGYKTFPLYCEAEWGMTARNAYHYIEVIEKLPPQIVKRVSQLGLKAPSFRRLLALPDEKSFLENLTEADLQELAEISDAEFNEKLKNANARYMKIYRKQEKSDQEIATLKAEKADMLKKFEELNREIFTLKTEEKDEKVLRLQQDRDNLLERIKELESKIHEHESRTMTEEQAFALIRKSLDQVIGILIELRRVKLFPAILPQIYGTYTVIRDMLNAEITYLIDTFNPEEGPLVLKHLATDVDKIQKQKKGEQAESTK